MKDTRRGLRVKCDSRCILEFGESKVECILEDLSVSGALVRVPANQAGIHPGSECGLCLCHDPDICPGKYSCIVSRVSHNDVGLTFVNSICRFPMS
jgi:hypothetical protein